MHQFVRLGRLSIVGGCSRVVQDVPPFAMVVGHPVKVIRTNAVGLQRAQIPEESVRLLNRAYKILFRQGLPKTRAIEKVESEVEMCPEVEHLIFFCKTTKRGLCS